MQYKVPPTEEHHAREAQLGGLLLTRMDPIQSAHYRIPAAALQSLSEDPNVAFVTPDRPVHEMLDITRTTVHADVVNMMGWTGWGVVWR